MVSYGYVQRYKLIGGAKSVELNARSLKKRISLGDRFTRIDVYHP